MQQWIRTLQQALSVESDRGFINLPGRNEQFHEFISRELVAEVSIYLPHEEQERLKRLSKLFSEYPDDNESKRRRNVVDARQFLYKLYKETEEPESLKPLKLRLDKSSISLESFGKALDRSLSLRSSLLDVKGIGPKIAEKLSAIGLFLIKDILLYYPRDYVDYSSLLRIGELYNGRTATVVATVRRCNSFTSPKNANLSMLDLYIEDPTGRMKLTRFYAGRRFSNRGYLKSQERLYPSGSTVVISGLVKENSFGKTFVDPIIETLENSNSFVKSENIGRLLPVYSLRDGLKADRFRKVVELILPFAELWPEHLSSKRLISLGFPQKKQAIFDIHKPKDSESLRLAKRRLVFDEFFLFQLSILLRRYEHRNRDAPSLSFSCDQDDLVRKFISLLPFKLTKAQQRVLFEIKSDIELTQPMSRLIQGDVGSGKTVVATAALLYAVQAGWQGALMAPTEVLAYQHFTNLCKWLPQLNVTVELLTGSTPKKRRKQILNDLSSGNLQILVGTHALIEDPVLFSRLGLVVVDEQHRFGVNQRNRLLNKGLQPHLLTMTATPIPRTLALSIHGDLDVSQIDELPPGRTPVETELLPRSQIKSAYKLIREQVLSGCQAYVVLPLVEESDKMELRSANEVYKELSMEVFPDFSIGLLHGRMQSVEKQLVIKKFASRQYDVLVSTTVVEVGVDVPNATVMLIDNADRFGLAQLHQLRGRVGRGAAKSHCLLIYDKNKNTARERLEVLANSDDGFEISEIDLRLRGPGQFLGTKQSGLPDFALASLVDDADILEIARTEAIEVLDKDPTLTKNSLLRTILKQQYDDIIVNSQLN